LAKKLNERKSEQAQERQGRPGPLEDAEPDSGRADVGRQLTTDGRGKPNRVGAAELRHEDFDGAEMHNEGDQTCENHGSKKPRYNQVGPIAGPRGGFREVKGSRFGRRRRSRGGFPILEKVHNPLLQSLDFQSRLFQIVEQPQVFRQGSVRWFDDKYHFPVLLYLPLNIGKIVEIVSGDKRILALTWVMHFKCPLLLHGNFSLGDEAVGRADSKPLSSDFWTSALPAGSLPGFMRVR
jgi:hypothetical protein